MKYEIVTPSVPNFVKVDVGKKETVTLPVSDLSDEEIEQVGKKWTADLKVKARRVRY